MVENTNLDIDYDEYEKLESEAESMSSQPVANNRRMTPQMNEQDVEYADEEVEEEIEAAPTPKPVRQRQPHTSNMSARARVPVPVIDPKTGRPERVKSTEDELEEISAEEATAEVEAEANQLAAEERMPLWMPFHQPEKIGVINTQTKEIIEGFKDEGSAAGTAKILNEVNSMIVNRGYQ